jgi:DNA-directed RNA polymerase I, II, and III subunit RPABC2
MSEVDKKIVTNPDEESIDSLLDDQLNEEDWDGEDDIDDDVEDNLDSDVEDNQNDDCVYKPLQKKRGLAPKPEEVIDDDDDDDDDGEEEILKDTKIVYITGDNRISSPILTKYEKARLIGDRIAQLTMGAKPMIKDKDISKKDPAYIAQMELEKKTIPIKIIRPLPNGTKEIWHLNELKLKREHIKFDI